MTGLFETDSCDPKALLRYEKDPVEEIKFRAMKSKQYHAIYALKSGIKKSCMF